MPISSSTAAGAAAPDPALHKAAQALEALMLRQIVVSSGAFKGGETAGGPVREGLFADTLATALAQSGGIGLAAQIERSLSGASGAAASSAPRTGSTVSQTPPASPAPTPTPGQITDGLGLVQQARVTSGFGQRADPFTGRQTEHHGVDLAAPEGSPIVAASGGVVRSAGPRGGYGNAVEVDHGNGLTTLYAHTSEVLVRPGETVAAGQVLAKVGHTGRATGAHLHFEVRVQGRPVDPVRALKVYSPRADGILERGP
jgi:murein DD-endopeptidase MepM/ murein hydrolase activator NlpD